MRTFAFDGRPAIGLAAAVATAMIIGLAGAVWADDPFDPAFDGLRPYPNPTDVKPFPSTDVKTPAVETRAPEVKTTPAEVNVGPAPAPSKDSRLPVPSVADRAKAAAQVNQVFEEQMLKAVKPTDKLELSKKIVEASDTSQDTAVRYVLLCEAGKLALQAGDLAAALKTVDKISTIFRVDALEAKAELVLNQASLSPADAEELGRLIDQALVADNYKLARSLASAGTNLAKRWRDASLYRWFSRKADAVEEVAVARSFAVQAADKVETDPASAMHVGRFLCFMKNDWEVGLPALAKSNNQALAKLTPLEISKPTDSKVLLELADKWWDVAEKESGVAQQNIRDHAAGLYKRIVEELTGLDQVKARLRIEKATPQEVPTDGALELFTVKTWILSWKLDGDKSMLIRLEPNGKIIGGDQHERTYRLVGNVLEILGEDGSSWLRMTYDPNSRAWIYKPDTIGGGCGVKVLLQRTP